MSTLKVDGIRSNSASSDAITLASDGTCTANITNNLSNRNIIINGAMQVAQRGTSSTSSGYATVDRFPVFLAGTDEAPTQAQVDVAAGTTPYTLGFRKALKVTNGNQTSGANSGSTQYVWIQHKIEAQNIASSGWNYLSASSYVTLSFWVKSSVAQTFKGYIETIDGTAYQYPFETGSLTANTWTKVIKKIPGNANLTFNHDNGEGFKFSIVPFISNNKTESSVTEDAWGTYNSSARMKDSITTWYTTNDATFELTGVQLEVSDYATDFEHRSYGVEKRLCMRYYQEYKNIQMAGYIPDNNARAYALGFNFPVEFRAAPTLTISNTGSSSGQMIQDGETGGKITTLVSTGMTSYNAEINVNLHADMTNYRPAVASSAGWTTNETKYMFNGEL